MALGISSNLMHQYSLILFFTQMELLAPWYCVIGRGCHKGKLLMFMYISCIWPPYQCFLIITLVSAGSAHGNLCPLSLLRCATVWLPLSSQESQVVSFIFKVTLKKFKFIGCAGSSLLHPCFLWLQWAGLLSSCSAWSSPCSGFSCCRAQAQKLWCTGLVALQQVESSWTRDRTHIPCTGRLISNCWTTRKVPHMVSLVPSTSS